MALRLCADENIPEAAVLSLRQGGHDRCQYSVVDDASIRMRALPRV